MALQLRGEFIIQGHYLTQKLKSMNIVGSWDMSFHLKTNWWWGRHTQIFYGIQYCATRTYFLSGCRESNCGPPTIPLSQWHSRDSNPWPYLWYHLSDRELYNSTSKPISDEEDILKSFMAFDITPRELLFRVIVGSQIVVPQQIWTQLYYIITIHYFY